MTGQHLRDLANRVTGMSREDVLKSQTSWENNADSLGRIEKVLSDAGKRMKLGFGDTEIAATAEKTFTAAATKLSHRSVQMENVSRALDDVYTAMGNAELAAQDAPDAPGPPPAFPSTTGDETDEIQALKIHAGRMRSHNTRVGAYGDADEDARIKIENLVERYNGAIEVLSKIEDPPTPGPGGGPQGGQPPFGGPDVPLAGGRPTPPGPGGVGGVAGYPPPPGGVNHLPPPAVPGEIPGYQPAPSPGLTPGGSIPGGPGGFPGGGGIGPAVLGGGLAAGALGGPGLVNGIRGLLSRGGLTGNAGTIGATTRAGGPGSLGRPGTGTGSGAVPGSQAGRGTGGRGAGGRGGVPGGQAGRSGGRGGRGAGVGAGGRGRKPGEDETVRDRDLFDDGEDWIDDEGAAPSLLD